MRTIAVLIGNSDDKLPQAAWSDYVDAVTARIRSTAAHVYFQGGPPTDARHQNVCLVFEIMNERVDVCRERIAEIAGDFRQDAVGWLEGKTEFVQAIVR